MSSPFWANLRAREKSAEKRVREMPSTRHEQVYHAAQDCQAAALSETSLSWRGLFWVCQVESQKMQDFWLVLSMISQSEVAKQLCGRVAVAPV